MGYPSWENPRPTITFQEVKNSLPSDYKKVAHWQLMLPNCIGTTKSLTTLSSHIRRATKQIVKNRSKPILILLLSKGNKKAIRMMNSRVLTTTFPLCWAPPKIQGYCSCPSRNRTQWSQCSSSSSDLPLTTVSFDCSSSAEKPENNVPITGGAYDFEKATISLTRTLMPSPKKVTIVRHGLSSWNEESRVQGSSDLSILTETGVNQAERCRKALANISFDQCFSSPISRAKSTAEILWHGKEEPLVFLDSLKEGHLFYLEGMRNVDARRLYPKEYTTWREDPSNFTVNGVYPVRMLWETANEAWKEILFTPGDHFLVVTHKSMLRALICTALGLGPERFRAIDVNNGGISVFNFNKRGEAMLQSLNMTAHMHIDHVYLY